MVVEFPVGLAVVRDNRGGRNRPVTQRPDGSWSFEEARKRREQRQAAETTSAVPALSDPEEDFSALALSLADNLTIEGTPLSQMEIHDELDGLDAPHRPTGTAPTADEIMRGLEAEQDATAYKRDGAEDPRPIHSPHRPKARQDQHRRRLHARRHQVITCALGAAIAAVLVVEVNLGGGATTRKQTGLSPASHTAAATPGLIAAATEKFLAVEHAADRNLGRGRPLNTRAPRPLRHRHTPARAPSGSTSSSTATSSTSGTSEAVDASQQASPPSFSPSSSSTSSGSSQPPPQTQPHTSPNSNSSSGSSSPTTSKAALKSLVTGAGTCSCQ